MSERTLRISKRPMQGDDVAAWQRTVNARFAKLNIGLRVDQDGVYGRSTRDASEQLLYALGIAKAEMARGVTPELRVKIRNNRLTAGERARFASRIAWRRRLRRRYAGKSPRIITSAQLGLRFQNVFGAKGPVARGAWHYTAGGRARNATELAAEMRADHRFHAGKGWGGGSYEAMIADDGTIGFLNPVSRKSAGVAGHNTGLVNICCPGTTGDHLTAAQTRSVQWLRENWHTRRVPRAYRLPRPARPLGWRGHREYPGNPTACPGVMLGDYKEAWS